MKSRDVIALLRKAGFQKVGQKGSHVQFKHRERAGRVTVPHPGKRPADRYSQEHRTAERIEVQLGAQAVERRHYPAQVEGENGAYGVWFIDFPGCVSAGRTIGGALEGAEESLALHIAGMVEDREEIPAPSEAEVKPGSIAVALVAATMPGKKKRVNVTLDENVLAAIDAVASNRSDFLERAARKELAEA